MRLQTILNSVQKFKSFVYTSVKLNEKNGTTTVNVTVKPRRNSKPICSGCDKPGSCYDHLAERQFEFIPLWGLAVYFCYRMRRVDCKRCGVKVESVPWADGKQTMTKTMMQFLADWAKKLSWQETARSFNTSWPKVFSAVKYVVEWGLARRDYSGVESIGVDEIAWQKGHKYLTVVYQIDAHCTRLLWVGKIVQLKLYCDFSDFWARKILQT